MNTLFEAAPATGSGISKVLIDQCGPGHRSQHLFAPCLHVHRNGQLLVVCRWDEHGSEEGDATNQQALYFSRDHGRTWSLSGDGPILTCQNGSSFATPSSITHAWVFEDLSARTWLYYTVNQPFSWGEGRPDRSTGGGEIRKLEISWAGDNWVTAGQSQVAWGFQQTLPDGQGSRLDDIRVVSWNGLVRLQDGSLVMPIGGRSSVAAPEGAFSRLNRVWVLVSRNDGRSWNEAYFVGGDDTLCVAEPTLVETSTPGELVCLLRVQYGNGNQLHRTVSRDGGRSWTPPQPTGLPQAGTQGVKPYLMRHGTGRYALIQTNEHQVIERTNIALFLTDESGLLSDSWPQLRTLHIGNRRGWWPGSCYGWLASAEDGSLLAAFPCHDRAGGRLYFCKLTPAAIAPTVALEANGVLDEWGDDVPRRNGPLTPAGEASFVLRNVRGRLVAPDFGIFASVGDLGISLCFAVISPPPTGLLPLLRLTSCNGYVEVLTLLLGPAGGILRATGLTQSFALPAGRPAEWVQLRISIRMALVEVEVSRAGSAPRKTSAILSKQPTGLQIGGAITPEPCEVLVGDLRIRASRGQLSDTPINPSLS